MYVFIFSKINACFCQVLDVSKAFNDFTYCTIYTLRWSVQVFDGTYNKVEDPPTPLQAVVVLTFCFRGFSGQSP